jgi:hypothetical protein
MSPDSAGTPNRSRWMRAGRECMQAGDWAGAIRAYGQGLMEQPQWGRGLWQPIRAAVWQQGLPVLSQLCGGARAGLCEPGLGAGAAAGGSGAPEQAKAAGGAGGTRRKW